MPGEAVGWRKRSRGGDALWGDVLHSAPEFLCTTPNSRGTSLPRASLLPAAEVAQRLKTVAVDPEVLLPAAAQRKELGGFARLGGNCHVWLCGH